VRSHSTVVAPVAKSIRPPVVDHGLPQRGELAPTWPGTPGGEEFPYSVKRPPKIYVRRQPIWEPDAIHLRAPIRTHSDAVRSGTATPDHLSDDVGAWSRIN
jgi:hypothetical protein